MLTAWIAGIYVLMLPATFDLSSTNLIQRTLGGVLPATELTCSWKNKQDESIEFSLWSPMPTDPGRPIEVVSESKFHWAGQPASLVETRLFNGIPLRVAAAFQRPTGVKADARIYSQTLRMEELQILLEQSRFADPSSEQTVTSKCSRLSELK